MAYEDMRRVLVELDIDVTCGDPGDIVRSLLNIKGVYRAALLDEDAGKSMELRSLEIQRELNDAMVQVVRKFFPIPTGRNEGYK